MGTLKTGSIVRNGPWGCLCDCGIRNCGGPRDGISEMVPRHLCVSPRVPLGLWSWPWCESPQLSCLAKGVRKKGQASGPACWEVPATGRLCIGVPWSLLERYSPSWHSSKHHRKWYCWQQTLPNTILKIESRCHSESGSKPQGQLAKSSPAMQRCFYSINITQHIFLLWK